MYNEVDDVLTIIDVDNVLTINRCSEQINRVNHVAWRVEHIYLNGSDLLS
mgnify:CR=1 FL=1